MVHGVMLTTQPSNIEWLIVVVVMSLAVGLAALFAGLANHPPSSNHGGNDRVCRFLFAIYRVIAKSTTTFARGLAKIRATLFKLFRVVFNGLIPSLSVTCALADATNRLSSARTVGRLIEGALWFHGFAFCAPFFAITKFSHGGQMLFSRFLSARSTPAFHTFIYASSTLRQEVVGSSLVRPKGIRRKFFFA